METLKSRHMVVGHPYRLPNGIWILPLRKTIRSKTGDLVWVVTLVLDLQRFLEAFPHNNNKDILSLMIKDRSFERVFRSHTPPQEYERYFGRPFSKKRLGYFYKALKEQGTTLEDLRRVQKPKLFEFDFVDENRKTLKVYICIKYDKEYHLWSVAASYDKSFMEAFLPILLNHLLVFLLIVMVLFFLFKRISALEKKRFEELHHQATHDPLTNLPNRYYMKDIAQEWMEDHEAFSLLFVDLDNFKNINDTMGHPVGDRLLVLVAERIKEVLLDDATLIRHGGDEFVIFCGFHEISKIEKLAYELLQNIARAYKLDGMELMVSGSIGISRYPDDGRDLDELLSAADIAMYRAKELKNSFRHFSLDLIEKQKRAIEIERALHHAIERDELYLTYQPQISTDMRLHGVEALLRWKSSELGEVSPAEFISVAEKSGLIIEIGRFVIKRALEEVSALFKELDRKFTLSINVSTKQFAEHNFVPDSYKRLDNVDIDPQYICVEITESLLIDNLEYILDELDTIRQFGIDISMDDFGTGYSSLHMLQNLPIKELKIDKSFIDEMLEEESAFLMVKTIINIAKVMQLRTVAEGIETKEQVLALQELGCDTYQGYFFAKPMKKEELAEFVRMEKWKDKL